MELGVWHIALILERIIRTFEQLYPRGIMVRLSKALFLKMRDGAFVFCAGYTANLEYLSFYKGSINTMY